MKRERDGVTEREIERDRERKGKERLRQRLGKTERGRENADVRVLLGDQGSRTQRKEQGQGGQIHQGHAVPLCPSHLEGK